mmetsp:Transcript_97552/g.164026  ORF Transcript_97552/g.164026 Transcript_97552/m.164026 type:complete len:141 (-) Transcript_97552:697-1119(-)
MHFLGPSIAYALPPSPPLLRCTGPAAPYQGPYDHDSPTAAYARSFERLPQSRSAQPCGMAPAAVFQRTAQCPRPRGHTKRTPAPTTVPKARRMAASELNCGRSAGLSHFEHQNISEKRVTKFRSLPEKARYSDLSEDGLF